MKGRINFIYDVAKNFGFKEKEIECYIRLGELSEEDGIAVFHFYNNSGFIAGKVNGKMIAALKLPERRDDYWWAPRKEAA